ncbi:Aldehyde dehydrogenase PuuC (plasmid) [Paracoccaceae bacterium]|nr:Aldehyde dehydrogenase PuuC [Paracoccaceae bacterium]
MHFDPRSLDRPAGMFVGGMLTDASGDAFVISCPSDPDLKLPVRMATRDDMDRAVETCRAALKSSGWGRMGPRPRAEILNRWADLVDAHAGEIAALEALASSRPYTEVMTRDVKIVSLALRMFSAYADTHESVVTATPSSQFSYTRDEPYGVVAAISPWNFPIILSAWKFAPALAAGNGVVLKPSEFTPFGVLRIAALAREAGLPDGLFNVVLGDGQVGQTLVRHPGVDYVTFTGSSRTGALIMADAAQHGLKPVSLELGGKGPQVVFDDASDLDKIADLVARGVTYNSGQACFSGSRLIVQSGVKDALLDKIAARMAQVRAGATWEADVTLPPVINEAQLNRMAGIVDASVAEGGKLVMGGHVMDGRQRHFEPTILDGIGADNIAFREEIFGPVLSVDTFTTFDEAIAKANHPDYGLTASVWTRDIDAALSASQRIESGTVWINHWGRAMDMTSPFGGVKRSGIGKDMGRQGYGKYLKSKAVWVEIGEPAA